MPLTLVKSSGKNKNLRNNIEIVNIFRMYSFESTITTNSSLRPNMNLIRAVLRCIGPYKNNTYDLIHLPPTPLRLPPPRRSSCGWVDHKLMEHESDTMCKIPETCRFGTGIQNVCFQIIEYRKQTPREVVGTAHAVPKVSPRPFASPYVSS